MRLNILKEKSLVDSGLRIPRTELELLAKIIGKQEKISRVAEVNLIITDDKQQRALNKQFRALDKTTDVLSFPLDTDGHSSVIGEIYISITRAQSQAKEFKHSVAQEILRLGCHGLFHIMGYDHKTDETAELMEALERRALEQMKNRRLKNKIRNSQNAQSPKRQVGR